MNQLLTDEEIINIADDEQFWDNHFGYQECDAYALAKAIEQAILSKLNSVEPVAWQERQQTKTGLTNWYDSGKPPSRDRKLSEVIGGIEYQWRPLFTHPPAPSAVEGWTAIHLKTGNEYQVIGEAIDATNTHCNQLMVIYQRDGKTFVREAEEFQEKFKAAARSEE